MLVIGTLLQHVSIQKLIDLHEVPMFNWDPSIGIVTFCTNW